MYKRQAYGLDDILASIKKAKDNDKIKGIYIQPSYLEASYASLEEIRNALLDLDVYKRQVLIFLSEGCPRVDGRLDTCYSPVRRSPSVLAS